MPVCNPHIKQFTTTYLSSDNPLVDSCSINAPLVCFGCSRLVYSFICVNRLRIRASCEGHTKHILKTESGFACCVNNVVQASFEFEATSPDNPPDHVSHRDLSVTMCASFFHQKLDQNRTQSQKKTTGFRTKALRHASAKKNTQTRTKHDEATRAPRVLNDLITVLRGVDQASSPDDSRRPCRSFDHAIRSAIVGCEARCEKAVPHSICINDVHQSLWIEVDGLRQRRHHPGILARPHPHNEKTDNTWFMLHPTRTSKTNKTTRTHEETKMPVCQSTR